MSIRAMLQLPVNYVVLAISIVLKLSFKVFDCITI